MPPVTDSPRELHILEQIERDPEVTQATLAERLGVAVGTINFTVKRLVNKGYVRVKQLERRRLQYIITPAGIALRTKLAMDSLAYSMRLYRETREQAKQLVKQIMHQGHRQIGVRGKNEVAEVVRLTCLEAQLEVCSEPISANLPVIIVEGADLKLELPEAG